MLWIYRLKNLLRLAIARLWPLMIIAITLAVLTSGEKVVHPTKLGQAVFGQHGTGGLTTWNDRVGEWAVAFGFFLAIALVLRVILGLIAGDYRMVKRLSHWLKQRDGGEAANVSLNRAGDNFMANYGDMTAAYKNHSQDTIADYLNYRRVLPESRQDIAVNYTSQMVTESWRPRRIMTTTAHKVVNFELPRIILISKTATVAQTSLKLLMRDPSQFVSLEGNFSRSFAVYVARGYEMYALDVLSPDVMAQLEDHCDGLDIELTGRNIWVYQNGFAITPKMVESFEAKVDALLTSLLPYLKRQSKLSHQQDRLQHQQERFDPTIKPFRLWSDRLLKGVFTIFIFYIPALVIIYLWPPKDRVFAGYTYLQPWRDVGNTIMFFIIVIGALAIILGEIEVFIRRLVLSAQHARNRQARR